MRTNSGLHPLPIIRQARLDDATELFAVHRRSVHSLCASSYSAEHIATWFSGRSTDMYLPALQAGQLWVAESNGQVIGFVGAEPGEVTLLFVAPEVAGRSIGSMLFEFGLLRASENFQGLVTVVATRNSVSFYRRFGFNEVEELSFVRGEPELHYPVVRMVRNPVLPNKACAVVLRESEAGAELLVFAHPIAGIQLVKGTVEAGESCGQAALRELDEEAGIAAATVTRHLGIWDSGFEGQVWSFSLCTPAAALPDAWEHHAADDGGHLFRFFWHPLAAVPTPPWHPLFQGALGFIQRAAWRV